MNNIILFDGLCNFCSQSVQFIIKRDPSGVFQFASLQSEIGQNLLIQYGINKDIDSFVYISGKKAYVQSSAALQVCRRLSGPWKCLFVFYIVPRSIRNFIYDFIAKNRYKWFGKKESCMIPSPELRKRFLDQ